MISKTAFLFFLTSASLAANVTNAASLRGGQTRLLQSDAGESVSMWSLDQLAIQFFEETGLCSSNCDQITNIDYKVFANSHGGSANFKVTVENESFTTGTSTITKVATPTTIHTWTTPNPTNTPSTLDVTNMKSSSAQFSATTSKGFSSTTSLEVGADLDVFSASLTESIDVSIDHSTTQTKTVDQTWSNTYSTPVPAYTTVQVTELVQQQIETIPYSVNVDITLTNPETNLCVQGEDASQHYSNCYFSTLEEVANAAAAPFTGTDNKIQYSASGELKGVYGLNVIIMKTSWSCTSTSCPTEKPSDATEEYFTLGADGSVSPLSALP